MRKIHSAIRWENEEGYFELRFFSDTIAYVTGHWKAWEGPRHYDSRVIADDHGNYDRHAFMTALNAGTYRYSEEEFSNIYKECKATIMRMLNITI